MRERLRAPGSVDEQVVPLGEGAPGARTPTNRSRVLSGAAALACLAAVVAAGCGGTVIDDSKAEGALQHNLEGALKRKVPSVECPSDQKVEAGATFKCTVDFADGEQATATLKIVNEDADVKVIGLRGSK